jgi:twitching motility protein PilT
MRRIDFYVQHLVRHNAREVELRSGQPVRFGFPGGDRTSNSAIEHPQIAQLVQEAAPLTAMEALRREGAATFEHSGGGVTVEVQVRVQSGNDWRVLLVPRRGGRLTPGPDTLRRQGRGSNPNQEVPLTRGTNPGEGGPGGLLRPETPSDGIFERPLGGAMLGDLGESSQIARGPEHVARARSERKSVPVPRVESIAGEPAINRYLREMVRLGASDLHLSSSVEPMMRIDGEMRVIEGRGPLDSKELERLLMEIAPERNQTEFEASWDTDFAHNIEGVARFRANYFVDRKGIGAVFRQIPFEIISVSKLGLPQGVLDLCWLSKGLVLVTGPTGSGKSTTLASLIDYINDNRTDHIITIEDPIEFVHGNKKCLLNQREVGTHTKSFKAALRAALREDPDIVLVGEMRDLETIAIAIETAETGHLVFGTLHTTSAKSTVDRIIDQFPTDQQEQIRVMLSESLRGVIAQVLCKKVGGGRIAGYEVLITNPAVSNLIREGKTYQLTSVMQTGKSIGMQTMNDHIFEHVKAGRVEPEEGYVKSNDKLNFKDMLQRNNIKLNL